MQSTKGQFLLFQRGDFLRSEKLAVQAALGLTHPACQIIRAALDDVLNPDYQIDLDNLAAPVGTVEFVAAVMDRFRFSPAVIDYPGELLHFLGRDIRRSTYGWVAAGDFVKPRDKIKLFTGHIKGDPEHAGEIATIADVDRVRVWTSPRLTFASEARYYIIDQEIVGWSRYDENEGVTPDPDIEVVRRAVLTYASQPRAYALDFGVLDSGRTVLVEVNDGWALGYYKSDTMPAAAYLRLITTAWRDIYERAISPPTVHAKVDPMRFSPISRLSGGASGRV